MAKPINKAMDAEMVSVSRIQAWANYSVGLLGNRTMRSIRRQVAVTPKVVYTSYMHSEVP